MVPGSEVLIVHLNCCETAEHAAETWSDAKKWKSGTGDWGHKYGLEVPRGLLTGLHLQRGAFPVKSPAYELLVAAAKTCRATVAVSMYEMPHLYKPVSAAGSSAADVQPVQAAQAPVEVAAQPSSSLAVKDSAIAGRKLITPPRQVKLVKRSPGPEKENSAPSKAESMPESDASKAALLVKCSPGPTEKKGAPSEAVFMPEPDASKPASLAKLSPGPREKKGAPSEAVSKPESLPAHSPSQSKESAPFETVPKPESAALKLAASLPVNLLSQCKEWRRQNSGLPFPEFFISLGAERQTVWVTVLGMQDLDRAYDKETPCSSDNVPNNEPHRSSSSAANIAGREISRSGQAEKRRQPDLRPGKQTRPRQNTPVQQEWLDTVRAQYADLTFVDFLLCLSPSDRQKWERLNGKFDLPGPR